MAPSPSTLSSCGVPPEVGHGAAQRPQGQVRRKFMESGEATCIHAEATCWPPGGERPPRTEPLPLCVIHNEAFFGGKKR